MTMGIDRHVHSYVIKRKDEENIKLLSELPGYPVVGHSLNRQLYITLRTHTEKMGVLFWMIFVCYSCTKCAVVLSSTSSVSKQHHHEGMATSLAHQCVL